MHVNDNKAYFALYEKGMEFAGKTKGIEFNSDNIMLMSQANNPFPFSHKGRYMYQAILVWRGSPTSRGWSLLHVNKIHEHVNGFSKDDKLTYRNPTKKRNPYPKRRRNYPTYKSKPGSVYRDDTLLNLELDELRAEYGSKVVKGRKYFREDSWPDVGLRTRKSNDWKANKCSSQYRKCKTQKVARVDKSKWWSVDRDLKALAIADEVYNSY